MEIADDLHDRTQPRLHSTIHVLAKHVPQKPFPSKNKIELFNKRSMLDMSFERRGYFGAFCLCKSAN
jgi:hypothetical protein